MSMGISKWGRNLPSKLMLRGLFPSSCFKVKIYRGASSMLCIEKNARWGYMRRKQGGGGKGGRKKEETALKRHCGKCKIAYIL